MTPTNEIDANFAVDNNGQPWLAWGSFWAGIKTWRLDAETGKLSVSDTTLYSVTSRRPLHLPPSRLRSS